MSNWSDEETDDPTHADRRNFYKIEQWSRDGHNEASTAHPTDHPAEDPGAAATPPQAGVGRKET
jgi:hypothetical protein